MKKIFFGIFSIFVVVIMVFFVGKNLQKKSLLPQNIQKPSIEIDGMIVTGDETLDITHLYDNNIHFNTIHFNTIPSDRIEINGYGQKIYIVENNDESGFWQKQEVVYTKNQEITRSM